MCECICDCGNRCRVVRDKLVSGNKTSCGCDTIIRRSTAHRNDLTGMRFGRLVVTEMLWNYRPTKCVCKCDCGKTVTVIASGIVYGKTQSCGCYQAEMASVSNTKEWSGIVSDTGIKFIARSKLTDDGTWLWFCECFCGNVFECLPAKIMNGHVSSCGCSKMSSGERYIESCLLELGLKYQAQYSDDRCKHKQKLKFDFAVFDNDNNVKLLIEYDGQQHYKPIDLWGGITGYEKAVLRDNIKNDFCSAYNIQLLRLPYTLSKEEIKNQIICALNP